MIKYAGYRLDISPKRDEFQQTDRYLFPWLAIWSDGIKYNIVGVAFGWWKWKLHLFFKKEVNDG